MKFYVPTIMSREIVVDGCSIKAKEVVPGAVGFLVVYEDMAHVKQNHPAGERVMQLDMDVAFIKDDEDGAKHE